MELIKGHVIAPLVILGMGDRVPEGYRQNTPKAAGPVSWWAVYHGVLIC